MPCYDGQPDFFDDLSYTESKTIEIDRSEYQKMTNELSWHVRMLCKICGDIKKYRELDYLFTPRLTAWYGIHVQEDITGKAQENLRENYYKKHFGENL